MNATNISGIDLNLLTVFAALMRTRNTTRASKALFVSQPAVSHALKRLREMLGDALFVRTSRGLVPTPRAEALWQELEPALGSIERVVLRAPAFDPVRSEREFRIGFPSSLDVTLTPKLLALLRAQAPGVNLVIRPTSFRDAAEQLDRGEVDVAMSVLDDLRPWHLKESLGRSGYLCLFDGGRLGIEPPISLERFLSLPHVLTSFTGERSGVVDTALEKVGRKRRVLVASPDFAAAALYLRCTEAVTVLPEYAARRFSDLLGLTLSRVPVDLSPFEVTMAWHRRLDDDPAQRWLRGLLRSLALEEPEWCSEGVPRRSAPTRRLPQRWDTSSRVR
jgi:DNA-binding transcriptional LysR family regulator